MGGNGIMYLNSTYRTTNRDMKTDVSADINRIFEIRE